MRRAMESWAATERLDRAVNCHGFRWDCDTCVWLGCWAPVGCRGRGGICCKCAEESQGERGASVLARLLSTYDIGWTLDGGSRGQVPKVRMCEEGEIGHPMMLGNLETFLSCAVMAGLRLHKLDFLPALLRHEVQPLSFLARTPLPGCCSTLAVQIAARQGLCAGKPNGAGPRCSRWMGRKASWPNLKFFLSVVDAQRCTQAPPLAEDGVLRPTE